MSITNYGELKTAVGNWLHRTGETALTNRAPEWIVLAEDKINLELRIRAMETATDLTVNAQAVSLPTRYIGTRRIYLSGTPNKPLEYMAPSNFWNRFLSTETGTPKAYTIEGENLQFGPAPDDTYTGKHLYWQAFANLSSDSDTNWVLSNARGLLLYGALLEASLYFSKPAPQKLTWAAAYDSLIEQVKASDRKDRYPMESPMARGVGVQVD